MNKKILVKHNEVDITDFFNEKDGELKLINNWDNPETGIQYTIGWSVSDIPDLETYIVDITNEEYKNQLLKQAEDVKIKLSEAIQERFNLVQEEIGSFFQSSSEFKTFAGFPNAFQETAKKFGSWEAEVWYQANVYKTKVLKGEEPMLTPEQALLMMPEYPLNN